MSRHRSLAWALGVIAVAMVAPLVPATPRSATPVALAAPSLNGAGSSFAKLEIDQWRAEVARSPFDLSINYVAQGSSFGRQQYISGALDFAASDIPFTQNELSALSGARANFAYVPVSAGGLGFMFNLVDNSGQRVNDLNLTPHLVCRIFTDPSMMWNDAELVAVNAQIAAGLPAERVRAIVRSDGSGTSYVLSEYCIDRAPDVWGPFVQSLQNDGNVDPVFKAGGPTSNWPPGIFGSALAADGVAAAVADSSGLYSITYNEAGFAKVRGFPNASVRNSAGVFTQPTEAAVSIALAYASGRADGTFELDFDGPDPAAYFPSTYSYVIAQTTGFDPAKGEVLAKFLCYSITKGQRKDLTEKLGYARLSAPLVEIGRTAIAKIPGAPAWENCKVESEAPPPAATTVPPANTTAATTPAGGTTASGGTTATGGTTPAGGTTATGGTTASGGTTAGGGTIAPTGSVASGAVVPGVTTPGGSSSGTGSNTGGVATPQTVVSIDPVTGEEVIVTVPAVASETGCIDPVTGLPAQCDAAAAGDVAGGGAIVAVDEASAAAAPIPINPAISDDGGGGPDGTTIAWWLLQGAAVCALGVLLSGARRRAL